MRSASHLVAKEIGGSIDKAAGLLPVWRPAFVPACSVAAAECQTCDIGCAESGLPPESLDAWFAGADVPLVVAAPLDGDGDHCSKVSVSVDVDVDTMAYVAKVPQLRAQEIVKQVPESFPKEFQRHVPVPLIQSDEKIVEVPRTVSAFRVGCRGGCPNAWRLPGHAQG